MLQTGCDLLPLFTAPLQVACTAPAHGSAAAPAGGPHATTASLLAQLADAVDCTGVLPGAFRCMLLEFAARLDGLIRYTM